MVRATKPPHGTGDSGSGVLDECLPGFRWTLGPEKRMGVHHGAKIDGHCEDNSSERGSTTRSRPGAAPPRVDGRGLAAGRVDGSLSLASTVKRGSAARRQSTVNGRQLGAERIRL